MSQSPGSFGPYRLEEQIGKGGMGRVYRAFDTRLKRPVAIKVMDQAAGGNLLAVERFIREARAASALNHPNIVTIHEIGQTQDGAHYIVQELIDGTTLRQAQRSPLTVEEKVEIGTQVARALAAAHAAGIVHRDVKPDNIMVRPDGYVKVLDFGLARMANTGGDPTEMTTQSGLATGVGTILGTTAYMSPEQARAGVAGPHSDVFSLGIVLYEMLAGRRPFVAETSVGLMAAILSEHPVSLVRLNPDVPAALDALVQRMLAKEAERRPHASEVEAELGAIWKRDGSGGPAVVAAQRITVGRETQRAGLRRAYVRAKSGTSVVLAVTGEPGIGKTSLAEDFLTELSAGADRPIVMRGRSAEQLAGDEAYLPLLEALDSLLHGDGGSSVNNAMKTLAPSWYFQVATAGSHLAAAASLRDQPAASQERLKRELAALFAEVSRAQPLVLFIEDLHWADISTIDMINYLASRFAEMRVLLLVTYRSAEMAAARHPFVPVSHELQSRGSFLELPLDFLQRADVDLYLSLVYPGHAFPASFAAMVHAKTEGSPLFVVDLLRYVQNSGGIRKENGRWVLAGSLPDSPKDLPASAKAMITRKIELLEPNDRKLLVAASVQGNEFDSATLAEAAEMNPADVEERLECLETIHVFVKRGEEREMPDRTITLRYSFVHVLYQNVLYASLPPTRRATLSGRVAKSMVAHNGGEVAPIAGRVALLFEAARDFAAAAQYFLMAAQHAVQLLAFRETLSLSERGLDSVRVLPAGPEAKQLELGLQMVKGVALRSTTGWSTPELEATFMRARAICQDLGDPPQVIPVLWAITLFHLIRGNLTECRDRSDEIIVKATETGNPAFLVAGHHMAGCSREFMGDMAESSRHLERARELHDPARHAEYSAMYGVDCGTLARAMSCRPLWALGFPDRALERGRETLALARTQRQPLPAAFAMLVLQGVLAYRGDAAEALALGEENIALCREHQLPQEAEWSRSFQGSALISMGRVQDGIDLLTDSLAVQSRIKTRLARSMFLALLADGLRRAGRIEDGLKAVDEGFEYAGMIAEGGYVAELHRMRGELMRLAGEPEKAEESLRAAMAYAVGQQAKSFELRAATSLASLLLAAGRDAEARTVLAPVYGWFTEGWSTSDLIAARSVLAGIG